MRCDVCGTLKNVRRRWMYDPALVDIVPNVMDLRDPMQDILDGSFYWPARCDDCHQKTQTRRKSK